MAPPPTRVSGEDLAALFGITQQELMDICGVGFKESIGLITSIKFAKKIAAKVGTRRQK